MVCATFLPCDAVAYGDQRPCAEMTSFSKSKRRKLRDRRVAVRRSQKFTLALKQCLQNDLQQAGSAADSHTRKLVTGARALDPNAVEFVPDLLQNERQLKAVLGYLMPDCREAEGTGTEKNRTPSVPERRHFETCSLCEVLPNKPTPDCRLVLQSAASTEVPQRRTLLEPSRQKALPLISSPCIDNVTVVPSGPNSDSLDIHESDLEELDQLTDKARLCLRRLEEAAALACKVEAAIGVDDSAKCVEQFLEDFHDLLDPEGVLDRLRENSLVEDRHRDLSMHVARYLFTYKREHFWKILHCLPKDIETEISRRSRHIQETAGVVVASASEAERSYFFQDDSRHWQDEYSEDDLLTVRHIVRLAVDAAVVDWD